VNFTIGLQMHVDAETNHCKTTSATEVLPDLPLSRPCRRTADPSSREKVRLENHALFFAVPTSVIQEIDR
jgi:hypothetical protein